MSYSFQIFTVGQVLTASQMNQVEVNIRDHVHGVAGVVGGNNVIALSTDTVSWGNSTTETTIVSFAIPANAIGSNSTIRVTAQCLGSINVASRQMFFNGYLGGTAVCSARLGRSATAVVVSSSAIVLNFLISGAGTTSLQVCTLYPDAYTIVQSSETLQMITDISTINKDATTALNCAIKVDSNDADLDTRITVLNYMVERIYL